MKKTVVIGLLGSNLDKAKGEDRWRRWRPSVAICQHAEFVVDRFELLHTKETQTLADRVCTDISTISPETTINPTIINISDPWDFEEVYSVLHEFSRGYSFDTGRENYLIHITTGTHVEQICLFLLSESRHFPGALLQTSPPKGETKRRFHSGRSTGVDYSPGEYRIIDLDLSKYDKLASRFETEQKESLSFLKAGIETRNVAFNQLIEEIEQVSIATRAPILLLGPTGAGKSSLAKRIFQMKQNRQLIRGDFVEVNCATLRGDHAMSTLFGHKKGAFTGAATERTGLLKSADQGILFLDEIGELGLDEQAMLLRAIEEKAFFPVGSDLEIQSNFSLIAGTNRDLKQRVQEGLFREDLLARINLWTFELPGLKERPEDLAPNIEFELGNFTKETGRMISFNREAKERFLKFAISKAEWKSNFRDLNAAITRMATLAPGGRIDVQTVSAEIERLSNSWSIDQNANPGTSMVREFLSDRADSFDPFDLFQLEDVITVCQESKSLSDAGRKLFCCSRKEKKQPNDSDRLRKYLAKFGLDWKQINDT